MFTGIIQAVGHISHLSESGGASGKTDSRVTVAAGGLDLADARLGDSIACNGVCLTVVDKTPESFSVDVSGETFSCTIGFAPGDRVNLERPLLVTDRLGGHIVQGHVDAVGEVLAPVPDLRVRMPEDLRRYVIEKGSITVDGVSLTVVQPTDDGFTVAVIPHTADVTTLGAKTPGDAVNLEVDLIAKYTERLLAFPKELPDG